MDEATITVRGRHWLVLQDAHKTCGSCALNCAPDLSEDGLTCFAMPCVEGTADVGPFVVIREVLPS